MQVSQDVLAEMQETAKLYASRAYAEYSKYPVGAAILTESGIIYGGCNIENASYGLTNCAERTAIFKARSEETNLKITQVVVFTPTRDAAPPCGACRQIINEFGPAAGVFSFCNGSQIIDTTLDLLLPGAFGPQNLV